ARLRARHSGDAAFHAIAADLRTWRPQRLYDLWHDRAVLHFMVAEEERVAYRDALQSAVKPGGAVIISTFAADGPERCSGLPVRRYSAADLDAFLGPGFERREAHVFDHETPGGAVQRFQSARYLRS
ncbi:MAG: SAM-dependent methyltransferase, partial [Salinarimonadaceae bacterium]